MLDNDKKNNNKQSNFRAYALVMSANFEAIAVFISAWYLSQYLQEHYQISKRSESIIYVVALLLICRSWFAMFKQLIKHEKNKGKK
jgi:ABC-type molybdate transport system substrate-binding protein